MSGRQTPEANEPAQLSSAELEQESAAELPERDEMSLINLNAAIPINAAIAANVLSDNASAIAGASQQGAITQGTSGTP